MGWVCTSTPLTKASSQEANVNSIFYGKLAFWTHHSAGCVQKYLLLLTLPSPLSFKLMLQTLSLTLLFRELSAGNEVSWNALYYRYIYIFFALILQLQWGTSENTRTHAHVRPRAHTHRLTCHTWYTPGSWGEWACSVTKAAGLNGRGMDIRDSRWAALDRECKIVCVAQWSHKKAVDRH